MQIWAYSKDVETLYRATSPANARDKPPAPGLGLETCPSRQAQPPTALYLRAGFIELLSSFWRAASTLIRHPPHLFELGPA
jgi:hypothetical protein